MKVVSNSGPLINLAKAGQFALLQDLFQHITIPPEVFEEVVVRGAGQPGAGETYTAQWIVRGMLERSDIVNLLTDELDPQVFALHGQIAQYPEDFPHLIDVIFALVNRPLSILQFQEFPGAPRSDDPSNARAVCLFARMKPLRRDHLCYTLSKTTLDVFILGFD